MDINCILLRYGEIALKGKNQKDFVNRLVRNIRDKLGAFDVKVTQTRGRLFIDTNGQAMDPIIRQLKSVFGLVGFSPAMRVSSEISQIKEAALHIVKKSAAGISSFRIDSRRVNKAFPLSSQEINQQVGSYVLHNYEGELKVNLTKPELTVHIEVRDQYTYIYGNDLIGLGGMPVGVSGKVMLLLSGGIDSPVAGFLSLKRGVKLECIHFHSYPFTSEKAKQKVLKLAKILTRFGGNIRVHLVPFTSTQTEINQKCQEPYTITIMRRIMVRIAERICEKNKILSLVTGESLGQVASQTIESIYTINSVSTLPILRPLIGMDKQEIINVAKQIGTYETSILPYEDCCTIFLPKSPKTKPSKSVAQREEGKIAVDQLVAEAVANTEIVTLNPDEDDPALYFTNP